MQKICVMKTKFVHLTWRKSNISHTNVKSLVNIIRAKSLLYRLLLSNLKSRPCNGILIIMVVNTDVWKIMEVLNIYQLLQIQFAYFSISE